MHIMLPKTSAFIKRYNGQTKQMCFFIIDNDLLEKCNTIWLTSVLILKKNLIANLSMIKKF